MSDTVLFDTDVLIWIQRGNAKAAALVEKAEERLISVQTYMELLQGAQNRQQHQQIRGFLGEFSFAILPFTENIGHRASIYVEEYSLGCDLRAGDAVVAATATENNLVLCSANAKHYRPIRDLQVQVFRP